MADMMDLDDLDIPVKAPARTSRFAPKNSKLKPTPKPKTEPAPSVPLDHSLEPVSTSSSTKDELVDLKPLAVPSSSTKVEFEPQAHLSAAANGNVKMDIEFEPEGELEPEGNILGETEDQLVREIDVFFNPTVDSNTQLYVLQYPLRQCWRPYELDQRCEQVRVKPTRAEVEVDLSVDADSQNFDRDADEKVKMTKQVLSSSWKPPLRTGYAVGVFMGNKLHLSPVHAVVQLRPSMQHFKSGGSRKKNNTNSNEEAIVKSEERMEEKTVVPSKKQNKPGVSSEQDKDIEECWIPLKYHGAKSDFSSRYVDKMVDREDSHIQFLMSPYDYLNSLCPGTSSDKIGPKGPSLRGLLSLPLEDRFKTWLLKGPIHRFATLKHLAPNDSDELVLGVLQKLAQLVQGLWVPKSSVLYGTDTGVEILARNFILLLFSKSPVITREQLPKNPHPKLGNAMKQTLNMIAVDRPLCHDWKFKEPTDTSFIKLHRNVYEEQQQTWSKLEKTITEFVKGRTDTKNSSRPMMSERPVASADNRSASRTSNGPLSMTPMTDETREALQKPFRSFSKLRRFVGKLSLIFFLPKDLTQNSKRLQLPKLPRCSLRGT